MGLLSLLVKTAFRPFRANLPVGLAAIATAAVAVGALGACTAATEAPEAADGTASATDSDAPLVDGLTKDQSDEPAWSISDSLAELQDNVNIEFYLADGVTDAQRDDLRAELITLQSEGLIATQDDAIQFVSKAEAFETLRERVGQDVVDQLPSNPLPDSFKVLPVDPANSGEIISRIGANPALSPTLSPERPFGG